MVKTQGASLKQKTNPPILKTEFYKNKKKLAQGLQIFIRDAGDSI